jgi:hypothetical protein
MDLKDPLRRAGLLQDRGGVLADHAVLDAHVELGLELVLARDVGDLLVALLAHIVQRPLVERIDGDMQPLGIGLGADTAEQGGDGHVPDRDHLVESGTEQHQNDGEQDEEDERKGQLVHGSGLAWGSAGPESSAAPAAFYSGPGPKPEQRAVCRGSWRCWHGRSASPRDARIDLDLGRHRAPFRERLEPVIPVWWATPGESSIAEMAHRRAGVRPTTGRIRFAVLAIGDRE